MPYMNGDARLLKLDLPPQIYIGNGSLNLLKDCLVSKGGKRALVIMDSFLASATVNLDELVRKILKEENLECVVFSEYSGEPTTEHVKAALEILKDFKADCVIGIGGGSAIDMAKAVSLFGKNPKIQWNDITKQNYLERLPLFAIPTTAGTGSEATKVMVVTNTQTNIKMNPSHPSLIPDVAILDPKLTLSLPRNFTVYTGLDALSHAIEAYVSNRSNEMTDFFALEAIKLISNSLPCIYDNGQDQTAREKMMLASCYAGIAFSNASTNLAHATGRPLGAHFHIPHGLSVALLLPFVIKFGIKDAEHRYANIAIALGADPLLDSKTLAQITYETIQEYNDRFNIWTDGRKYIDVQNLQDAIPQLSEDAMSGNGISTNLKLPTRKDVTQVYEMLFEKLEIKTVTN
jgi:alcohol dehydrogenase class IV